MKSLVFLLFVICAVSFTQAANQSEVSESARQLKKCNTQDVVEKLEQLVEGSVYSLANIVTSVGASAREGIACVEKPRSFLSCVKNVVTNEMEEVVETITDYISLIKTMIGEIFQDIIACFEK